MPSVEKTYPNFKDNDYLAVVIPATQSSLVFRVRTRVNSNPTIFYGPSTLTSGSTVSLISGGTATVQAAGELPAYGYTPVGSGLSFPSPINGAYDGTDMWYMNEDYRDRIFYIVARSKPHFLQMGIEIPKGIQQYRFQRDNVFTGVGKAFGFNRGVVETVQFPDVRQSWRIANDFNFPVWTAIEFQYNELIIETPRDPLTIYNILAGKLPAYRIDLPIQSADPSISINLQKVYGYTGFDMTLLPSQSDAVNSYSQALQGVLI